MLRVGRVSALLINYFLSLGHAMSWHAHGRVVCHPDGYRCERRDVRRHAASPYNNKILNFRIRRNWCTRHSGSSTMTYVNLNRLERPLRKYLAR